MIKKYEQYVSEQFNLDIDPYGEEVWDIDNLSPILQIAIKQNKPFDQITTLNCSNNQLTGLEGIENLINLQVLYCYNNQLTNDYKEYLREYCKKKNINYIKLYDRKRITNKRTI